MIRLAGMRLDSVVLLGADKSDESLGLTPRPEEQAGMGAPRPVTWLPSDPRRRA